MPDSRHSIGGIIFRSDRLFVVLSYFLLKIRSNNSQVVKDIDCKKYSVNHRPDKGLLFPSFRLRVRPFGRGCLKCFLVYLFLVLVMLSDNA